MELIHKRNGRLHIYVRQDKYKGEIKSKNWVGRAYVNGKQKVYSSGTSELDEAIPILEKWYDEIIQEKAENQENFAVSSETKEEDQKVPLFENENSPKTQNIKNNTDILIPNNQNDAINDENFHEKLQSDNHSKKSLNLSMFEKIKNLNFGKKKDRDINSLNSNPVEKKNKEKKSFFKNIFQSKVSKLSVAGEEIAGLDASEHGTSAYGDFITKK